MTANKRLSPRCLGSDLAKVAKHVIQPEEYEELPELTDEMLARGTVNKALMSRLRQNKASGARDWTRDELYEGQ